MDSRALMTRRPTALVADDEPLLRESLVRQLAVAWPELDIVAHARNGREAIEQFDTHHPDICFLDVRMPGADGVAVARHIAGAAHIVFVTAHDTYAIAAFEHGAIDYVLKPVDPARLAVTVARVRERLLAARPAAGADAMWQQLAARLEAGAGTTRLRWIHAQSGSSLRLIAVDDVDYFRSDHKLTLVAWRDESGKPADALVRTALKDLLTQLDPAQFVQVHRAVVVNLRAVLRIERGEGDGAEIVLKARAERLPVSRAFASQFRGM